MLAIELTVRGSRRFDIVSLFSLMFELVQLRETARTSV